MPAMTSATQTPARAAPHPARPTAPGDGDPPPQAGSQYHAAGRNVGALSGRRFEHPVDTGLGADATPQNEAEPLHTDFAIIPRQAAADAVGVPAARCAAA